MGNTSTKHHSKSKNKKQVHWKSADRPAPPGKPQLVSESESDQDIVRVRWGPSQSDGGSPIKGYLVEHRRLGSTHWVRATPLLVKFCEISLGGLEPGWKYQFRVSAENAVGFSSPSELSDELIVTLQRASNSISSFIQELCDTVALENDKVEFVTEYQGLPVPKVCWFKDGFEIFSSRRVRIASENAKSVLTFHQCSLSDEGEIKCTITNRFGHASSTAKLTVHAPPSIRLPRQYEDGLLFEIGELVKLKVTIAGRPLPEVYWEHDSEPIQGNEHYKIETTDKYSIVRIETIQRDDRGEYHIKAVNKLGEANALFLVTVTDKPAPPGQAQVIMTLGRSVTLSWSTPLDDGGCKIGNYIVEYFRVGWDVWLKAATCRQLSTTVGDLIEGSQYKFRVKAESPYGVSEPSNETDVIFIPDPGRGILAPSTRSRSQIREVLTDLSAKRPRSQSGTRSETLGNRKSTAYFYKEGIPVRPPRSKTKSGSATPEVSPVVSRRSNTDKNVSDRTSVVRDMAYGTSEIRQPSFDNETPTHSDLPMKLHYILNTPGFHLNHHMDETHSKRTSLSKDFRSSAVKNIKLKLQIPSSAETSIRPQKEIDSNILSVCNETKEPLLAKLKDSSDSSRDLFSNQNLERTRIGIASVRKQPLKENLENTVISAEKPELEENIDDLYRRLAIIRSSSRSPTPNKDMYKVDSTPTEKDHIGLTYSDIIPRSRYTNVTPLTSPQRASPDKEGIKNISYKKTQELSSSINSMPTRQYEGSTNLEDIRNVKGSTMNDQNTSAFSKVFTPTDFSKTLSSYDTDFRTTVPTTAESYGNFGNHETLFDFLLQQETPAGITAKPEYDLELPILPREKSEPLSNSSEFMLLLVPDRSKGNAISINFDEDSIAPPMSLSAPELGAEPPIFENLRLSVSSTELLHDNSNARLFDEILNKEHQPKIPKIQINSKDTREIFLERNNSLRRRLSAGSTTPQTLAQMRRNSLRNSVELSEIPENTLRKFVGTIDNTTFSELKEKREIFAKRQRSESEEREEEEFVRVRARTVLEQNDDANFQHKTVKVAKEEYWSGGDSISSSDSESPNDEPIRIYHADNLETEELVYHPGAMRRNIHEPFEILTKPLSLPDPNFIPKPILKRSEHVPPKPTRKSTNTSSNSAAYKPQIDVQQNKNSGLFIPLTQDPSIKVEHNPLKMQKTQNSPPTPYKRITVAAEISGITAASIGLPQRQPVVQRQKSEEEVQVMVDHYGDIVRSYGQRTNTAPRVRYLNTEELKAAADEESEEDISGTNEPFEGSLATVDLSESDTADRRGSFLEVSSALFNRVKEHVTTAFAAEPTEEDALPTEAEILAGIQRRGSAQTAKRRPSKLPINKSDSSKSVKRSPSGSGSARSENWSNLRTPSPTPQGKSASPMANRRSSLSPGSHQTRRTSLTPILTPSTSKPRMKEITTQTSDPTKKLSAKAELKVRTAVDYVTDVAMFLVACWLYLFHNELLAIPVLIVMVYRQLKEEINKRLSNWVGGKKNVRRK